jgi:catechol 2,3-dioxygenase-like lactoylglutathione lyase family enzyme
MRLQNVMYACEDYPAMVAFYRDGLGLEVFFENQGCCFLRLGSNFLALHVISNGAIPTAGACLDLAVPDVDLVALALVDRGLTVERREELAVVRDPAGNLVELVAQ